MTKEYHIVTVGNVKLDPTEFYQCIIDAVGDYLYDNYDIGYEKQYCFLFDLMKDIAKSFLDRE